MKGVPNRQKMVVRPRETVQKYVIQQKVAQKRRLVDRRGFGQKRIAASAK